MSDVKSKIQSAFSERQLAVLATINEEGKPWVRYVMLNANDDLTIRFATFAASRKVAHIEKNPEVHMTCGATALNATRHYMQIQGKAEVSNDPSEKNAYWNDGLNAYFEGPEDPNMRVVIIKPYRIEYQTMGSKEPEVWSA